MQIKSVITFLVFASLVAFNNNLSAKILVLNGLTHEHNSLQGETIKGIIEIKNTAETEQSVQIYQKDYWYWHTGESRHDEPGTLERSNAKWLTMNPLFVTLQPDETANIEYELTIPSTDSLIGTYWSVVMVEGITPPDTSAHPGGMRINTVVRYAVQIISNIGDTGTRNLEFVNFTLNKEEEGTLLQVAISNTGERMLRPELGMEIYDAEGESIGTLTADKRKLYPGTSANITIDLSSLKPGNYSGILIADCDEDHVFGTNLNLEIKNE